MTDSLWTPVSFTALPAGTFEAIYLDGDDFIRYPIVGVLIDEEVRLVAQPMDTIRTGVTRSVMAQQAEPGSPDVEPAGGAVNFVGVFPVGQEPLPAQVERARRAMAALDQADRGRSGTGTGADEEGIRG